MSSNDVIIRQYIKDGLFVRSFVSGKIGVIEEPVDGGFMIISNRMQGVFYASFNGIEGLQFDKDPLGLIINVFEEIE